jgi:hypothetical protein
MGGDRALKILLVLVGLPFCAAICPLILMRRRAQRWR